MSVILMVGRRRRCFWVWVRVREVFGLSWALRAGFPAGAEHRLLAEGDVAGGVLLQVLGVGVVWGAALVGGAVGGWRDW